MLKRKIHPELDDKIPISDGQKPAAGAIGLVITNAEQAAASHEAVSLLPIQGILRSVSGNLKQFICSKNAFTFHKRKKSKKRLLLHEKKH